MPIIKIILSVAAVVMSALFYAGCEARIHEEPITQAVKGAEQAGTAFQPRRIADFYTEQAETPWGLDLDFTIDEFPGISFKLNREKLTAIGVSESNELIYGMPIWNLYLADLNGDLLPELCAEVSMGSGIVDNHVVVYDYANDVKYQIQDRMVFDYALSIEDERLVVTQRAYAGEGVIGQGEPAIVDDELSVPGIDRTPMGSEAHTAVITATPNPYNPAVSDAHGMLIGVSYSGEYTDISYSAQVCGFYADNDTDTVYWRPSLDTMPLYDRITITIFNGHEAVASYAIPITLDENGEYHMGEAAELPVNKVGEEHTTKRLIYLDEGHFAKSGRIYLGDEPGAVIYRMGEPGSITTASNGLTVYLYEEAGKTYRRNGAEGEVYSSEGTDEWTVHYPGDTAVFYFTNENDSYKLYATRTVHGVITENYEDIIEEYGLPSHEAEIGGGTYISYKLRRDSAEEPDKYAYFILSDDMVTESGWMYGDDYSVLETPWQTYTLGDKLSFVYPADWLAEENQHEDGLGAVFNANTSAEFIVSSGADWHVEGAGGYRTADEYSRFLRDIYRDFAVINTENTQINGLNAQKHLFTFTEEDTLYNMEMYDVIAGVASYSFKLTYPSDESGTYGGIMGKIMDSICFFSPNITYTDGRTGITVDIPAFWRNKYGIEILASDWEDKAGIRIFHTTEGTLVTFIKWIGEYTDEEPPVADGVPQTILEVRDGFTYTYCSPETAGVSEEYREMADSLGNVVLSFRITGLSAEVITPDGGVYENDRIGVGIEFPPEYEGITGVIENEHSFSVIHMPTKALMERTHPFQALNNFGELFYVTRYEIHPDEDYNQIARESGALLFETEEYIYVLRTPSGVTFYEDYEARETREYLELSDYDTMIRRIIDSAYPVIGILTEE